MKKQRSLIHEDNYLFDSSFEERRSKRRANKVLLMNSENTNYNTINLLQKAIMKEANSLKDKKSIF